MQPLMDQTGGLSQPGFDGGGIHSLSCARTSQVVIQPVKQRSFAAACSRCSLLSLVLSCWPATSTSPRTSSWTGRFLKV